MAPSYCPARQSGPHRNPFDGRMVKPAVAGIKKNDGVEVRPFTSARAIAATTRTGSKSRSLANFNKPPLL